MKKIIRTLLTLSLAASMTAGLTGCVPMLRTIFGDDTSSADVSSVEEDVSGGGVSSLDAPESDSQNRVGNDQVGWLTVGEGFYQWHTPGNTETCVQYAKSPYEILSLDVMDCAQQSAQYGMEYNAKTAAAIRMYFLDESAKTENIADITGATVKLNGYDAYQVYCYYTDDEQFLVMWYMDSPDKTKVYYVAAEFRKTEPNFYQLAETYVMPE